MTKLGLFIGEDKWDFFNEIYDDLAKSFQTGVFKRKIFNTPILSDRLNRLALREGINSLLRRNDVCFFEWASELLMLASHMSKRCGIVTRLHSFELYEWAYRINWEAIDRIILVSQAMQRKFCSLYPEQAHKTVVIYNGIPLDKFKPSFSEEYQFRIGMLCNILPIKRVYEMVLTIFEMKRLGFNAKLFIAGNLEEDKRYTYSILRLIEKLNLQNNINLCGYIMDTPSWLQTIDIFISNSFWEGQQVALLEAVGSGCYCLSHNWDGADEILPTEYLFYTNEELVEKVLNYHNLPSLEKQKQREIIRAIADKKFDIKMTKSYLMEIIDETARFS